MDIVTQGLLGAGLAQAGARKHELRSAAVIGGVAGMLPDADALIRSEADPLLFLEFHRHFTHALVFIPVGACVATILLWPILRSRLPLRRIYFYALLGYALAGLLDACTSYGTHLLWPFHSQPIAWNIIAIVDPVFSLCLLLGVAIGISHKQLVAPRVGLTLACVYLALAAWQHERAEAVAEQLAAQRHVQPEALLVKPTLGNIVLWRSLYVADGEIHADAIRVGFGNNTRVYEGETQPLLTRAPDGADSTISARDYARFSQFADGLIIRHPTRAKVIGDARYSMLPNRLTPLWGIESTLPDTAPSIRFVTDRSMSAQQRGRFIDMLFGRDLRPGRK